jgi:hypothetical protein
MDNAKEQQIVIRMQQQAEKSALFGIFGAV